MVGCLGGLFASGATPHQWVYRTRWWSSDFGDFGDFGGVFGGAMGGATQSPGQYSTGVFLEYGIREIQRDSINLEYGIRAHLEK